jgi:hypothetical protein
MIEILLLFGIVFVSLGIVVGLARRWLNAAEADTAKWMEAFQGVARGGMAPMYRGDYDRPRYVKQTKAQNQYAQARYTQATERVTNPPIKFVRIDGKNDYISISQVAIYNLAGENIAPQGNATSSGYYTDCHHHHHHGKHYDWGSWVHRDNHGCHDHIPSKAIRGDLNMHWFDSEPDGIYHSSNTSAPWFEISLAAENDLKSIKIWNRADCCQDRLSGFKMKLLSSSRALVYEFTLNSNDVQEWFIPSYKCRAGYRKLGGDYDTTCIQNCAGNETADNNGRICYRPCNGGDYLEGGTGGTCKTPCESGFTLSGNTCYKNCVSPDVELDTANCYKPCKAGEDDTRRPKCYKVCTSGYRLIEDQCFPNDPATYLPIAWQGQVISQVDTTQNVGLCLPFPDKRNGVKAGFWGPISSPATDTSSDQIWAYTENMELVNMNNRKCLDTSSLTKTPLMWDCNNGITQKWFIDSENRIRSKQYPDRCLTTDGPNTYTTAATTKDPNPVVRLNTSGGMAIDLQPCTADGNKFQRWKLPGPRVGLQGVGASASAPPALPEPINRDGFIGTQAEPINRDGFADGGTQAEPLSTTLAQRTTDDAF